MIVLICDGSSHGNPGPASLGVVVWDRRKNQRIKIPSDSWNKQLGTKTSIQAEWEAVLSGVEYCEKNKWFEEEIYLFSDSQTIVKQANKSWQVKHENVIPIYKKFEKIACKFKHMHIYWIPRQLTMLADKLAQKKEGDNEMSI